MYTGSPCTSFIEGGNYYNDTRNTPYPYVQYKPIGIATPQFYFGNSQIYTSGGTVQISYLGSNNNNNYYINVFQQLSFETSLFGGPSCFQEAGLYAFTNGYYLSSDEIKNQTWTSLTATNGSSKYINWNSYVIDNACGHDGNTANNCLNGAYYYYNNTWEANNDN